LYVPDFTGFGPFEDNLDFVRGNFKAILSKDESKEFQFGLVKFAFVFMGIKSVNLESLEYFLDMFPVIFHVIRVDKDIVQID